MVDRSDEGHLALDPGFCLNDGGQRYDLTLRHSEALPLGDPFRGPEGMVLTDHSRQDAVQRGPLSDPIAFREEIPFQAWPRDTPSNLCGIGPDDGEHRIPIQARDLADPRSDLRKTKPLGDGHGPGQDTPLREISEDDRPRDARNHGIGPGANLCLSPFQPGVDPEE